ncbi:MAG: hypothetical protein IPI15_04175 [Saprospiraceae bacterium]|jgi:hypothetical protein|uniref:hypothetical protein n=1 Tax=Candidatus Brachybacter algidus TaxID=2982024 RepID=UPI00257DE88C|nr:hypothetical protein [Candidatus Brachybacter algidus]MBK7602776.1 hypothetical protein [Candidatus Brachybacter algidus]
MNGKYFTFLTLFLALSISLNAQKSISVANRAAEKCLVTNPGQSASASHSHLVQTIKSKANPSERANQNLPWLKNSQMHHVLHVLLRILLTTHFCKAKLTK